MVHERPRRPSIDEEEARARMQSVLRLVVESPDKGQLLETWGRLVLFAVLCVALVLWLAVVTGFIWRFCLA